MSKPRPIGPDTVTVLGSKWKKDAPWDGFAFGLAEERAGSIWSNDDYHLAVPWCHPNDMWPGIPEEEYCIYRVRPRRKQDRFVKVDGVWMVEARDA